MTKATIELIDQLCGIIDKSKYLILSGTMAVGKTYLANLIAEKSCEAKYCSQGIFNKGGTYEIETELISIHPSFYYEDFVNGIIIDTESGNINFHYADKVFLTLLKKANKSWEKKEDKKYFLILDDISRGAISGILGDMLPLIEPHGQTTYKTVLSDGETISVSPNVYIIATRSTLIDSVEQMNYGFLRHFYEYQLNNDYMYMCDSATDVYSDYDMSANAMFYRTKRIVTDYLRHRYQMSSVEKERYVIGHGMYKDTGTAMIARNQIIPLLRQYVKDNVLAKTANVSIAALQKLVDGQYSKDRTLADVNRIVLQKTGITADSFRSEGLTHQPFSAIEARVLSWLAGEMWRTEVFVNKGDIYCASASAMFGVPVEKHGQNAHLRQKGKIAELALGYGGAVGALKSMGAIEMGLAEEELQPLVDSWRAANPNIVKFWWDVDHAVKTAVKQKKQADVNGIRFFYQSGMLFIQLPSGRRLAYVKPRMGLSRFDSESVTYEGVGGTKKWERIESYGSKFVENIVQAISRDILCYAMRTLSHCMICAHVHDELIIECREDVSLDAICEQMGRIPPWAEGLVLGADGYCTPFYKKD